ncbi:hypothetical protein ABE137_11950 [Brevibacillus laterosporus]|uniref:hypothetical protein n=1 Tax=Brevibacillus phage Sundance TaxID=1691958 RepID=UPI0006BCFE66|nr:hypothetical protein AVT09_gp055 [Brevibacillus phage Sundance]ALA47871.1 hypothetical protein SUNDANCE_55 [Brevibacillus phage Sundance]
MEVVVRYTDYNEKISQVELPINADQRKVMSFIAQGDVEKVQMDTIDDTISFTVTQTFTKFELRDYVQVLQKLLMQMK